MPQPDADALVGRTVAHYEIVARLGGGGMGVVYRAIDRKLGRSVALKFLPPQWSHDDGARQRFLREAQAASATAHPNICTIHDIAATDDGQLFIVMAHYSGETLKTRLAAGPVPIDEALDIATQVADGLARAHAQGVVHRDVKPGNLILTEDGVRIVDFGLATFVDALQLTVEGTTLGTAAYMSPEQLRGQEIDARSDVWSLGVVLYQMLAGQTPFRGAYAEAIGHAIRNEPPPPLRATRPEIPEDVEQLVFRALHKDPAIRFQNGRDLARALRQVRGLTVPMDLRTTTVVVPPGIAKAPRIARRTRIAAALAVVLLLAGAPALVLMPNERIPVAVAPVANLTSDEALTDVEFALTHELIAQLSSSRIVRVVPYDRLRQVTRRFVEPGKRPSSAEALLAIKTETAPRVIVKPTLIYKDGGWSIAVDYQDPGTSTSSGTDVVGPEVSSLGAETVYRLTPQVARRIESTLTAGAPLRSYLSERLRALVGLGAGLPSTRLRNVTTAVAFERGRDAFGQQEHSAGLRFFQAAAEDDQRNPIVHAWRSRAAMAMRQDEIAVEAADTAARLVTAETPAAERMLIDALAAETRGDVAAAERAYRALVDAFADEPAWLGELGAFQDRRLASEEAIATYHRALAADDRLVQPHLELCRLYTPTRQNDPANAKRHGEIALARFRALGDRAGEGQALWCLTDVRRIAEFDRAREHADAALRIFQELGYEFNTARAQNYVALAAAGQGQLGQAVAFWEAALTSAERVGNRALQPLVLMQLGVAHQRLRHVDVAVDYSARSAAGFEKLGQEKRAAEIQVNRAQAVLEYGGDAAKAVHDIRNALAVFQKYKDRHFEVFSLRLLAYAERYGGRYEAAAGALARAASVSQQYNLDDNTSRLLIGRAETHFEIADYEGARRFLAEAEQLKVAPHAADIAILRGRVHARLGEFDAGRKELEAARTLVVKSGDEVLVPDLYLALGELEYRAHDVAAARIALARVVSGADKAFPDDTTVEATAYLGAIDAATHGASNGRQAIVNSIAHARRMGRHVLEARCRVLLARLDLSARRSADARRALDGIPADDNGRTVGRELRNEIEAVRSRLASAERAS